MWPIATTLLAEIASTAIVIGLVLVVAAWLLGPQNWAIAVRRRLAPTFATHPGIVYGVVAGVYLVLVAWGPIPALQRWLPIVIIGGVLIGALIALSRTLPREFATGAGSQEEGPT